jgi:DNA-binding response OmpR family regulator
LLLLTDPSQRVAEVLPALALLPHQVKVLAAEPTELLAAPPCDAVLLDARHNLAHARSMSRLIRTTGIGVALLVVVAEGGLAVVASDWGMDDVLLCTAGPAEVEARLRLAAGRLRRSEQPDDAAGLIRSGDVVVDDAAYTARAGGRVLDLTFKEFELLKFLMQHPGRVFSRQQLLQEVWGYDYFGGTRTVDVHVRRLRAKLGSDYDALIGTVRNVGYRFLLAADSSAARLGQPGAAGRERWPHPAPGPRRS